MNILAEALQSAGYHVANIAYPSRELSVEALAEFAIPLGTQACEQADAQTTHFVTHSLGGILVRQYYRTHSSEKVGRVVMLGPPNQGSEVVDTLRDAPGFELLNGPAGMQLGTDAHGIPAQLGPVNFQLGVIAGTKSINLLLSTMLPDPDDGKVSLASTQVEGMKDFVALPVSHALMMRNDVVIDQVKHFLRNGRFAASQDPPHDSTSPQQ
jgi:pimeloyl-ACP methyl ester carboxylesterase